LVKTNDALAMLPSVFFIMLESKSEQMTFQVKMQMKMPTNANDPEGKWLVGQMTGKANANSKANSSANANQKTNANGIKSKCKSKSKRQQMQIQTNANANDQKCRCKLNRAN